MAVRSDTPLWLQELSPDEVRHLALGCSAAVNATFASNWLASKADNDQQPRAGSQSSHDTGAHSGLLAANTAPLNSGYAMADDLLQEVSERWQLSCNRWRGIQTTVLRPQSCIAFSAVCQGQICQGHTEDHEQKELYGRLSLMHSQPLVITRSPSRPASGSTFGQRSVCSGIEDLCDAAILLGMPYQGPPALGL